MRLQIEGLARYLHAHSGLGRFVGFEALSEDAKYYYRSEARAMAGVLVGDVPSEAQNYVAVRG